MNARTEKTDSLRHLPHSYPFNMLDRIEEIVPGKSGRAVKMIAGNDPWMRSSNLPSYPHTFLLECLAQLGSVVLAAEHVAQKIDFPSEMNPRVGLLASADRFRFRGMIKRGDVIVFTVEVAREFGDMAKLSGKAIIDDAVVAEGEFVIALPMP